MQRPGRKIPGLFALSLFVMPAPVAGIHVLGCTIILKTWMAGTKPGHDRKDARKSNDHTRKGARSSGVASSLVAVVATNKYASPLASYIIRLT
jgi:hypothetical protein